MTRPARNEQQRDMPNKPNNPLAAYFPRSVAVTKAKRRSFRPALWLEDLLKDERLVDVSDERAVGDGFWVSAAYGWVFASTGCGTAHEYTKRDLLREVATLRPLRPTDETDENR